MSAEVGGRLEAVPARRSLFGPDYLRLAVLLAVAAAVHGWLVAHTAVTARDSLGYARIALNLSDPNAADPDAKQPRQRIDVIRNAEQPPGYPIAVWLTEKLLRPVTDLPLADRSLLATQVANAVAAVLLVIPLYLTGRILFGRNVAFAATLLFQVLPVPARVTSDGLSEGVYLLATAVAILLAVRAVRRPGIGIFLLCGMATGASYLVRPEGLLVTAAVTAVVVAAWLAKNWPREAALGRLTALAVGVALVAVPYMVVIGKLTNKPTGDHILNPLEDQPAPIWKGQPGTRAPDRGGSTSVLAVWWDPARDAGKSRELWAVGAVWSEVIKALHYVVGGLAIFGLIAHRRQLLTPDPGLWVLLVLGALNLLLLVYLAARIGYVSERHTVLLVMLSCTFAASALEPFAKLLASVPAVGRLVLWPRAAPVGLLIALVATALPYTLKPMHPQREGHKHAGRWLAGHIQPGDHLVDPLTWAEWYSGRTLYRTPEFKGRPPFTWVVVEKGKHSPHSRLPQWDKANGLSDRGELMYQWPERAEPGDPVVQVYRIKNDNARPAASKPKRDPRGAAAPPPPAEKTGMMP